MGCLNYTVAPKCWKGEINLYAVCTLQSTKHSKTFKTWSVTILMEQVSTLKRANNQHGNLLSGVLMAWTMGIVGGLFRVGGT